MAKLSRLLPLGQRFHSVLSSGTEGSYFTSGTELIVRAPPALAGPEFGVCQQARQSPH